MRVKVIVTLLTAILITFTLPQVSHAADGPSFEIKSVSAIEIDPGETVTWKVQVNLIAGWVKELRFALQTPAGDIRYLGILVEPTYKVSEAKSVILSIPLITHEYDLAGRYKLLYGWLYNEKEYFAYDPINAKEYAAKGYINVQNMSQFDITIRDTGSGKQKTPQLIDRLGFSKSQVDPGSGAKLAFKTSGTGSLVSVQVQLASPDGTIYAYCEATSETYSNSCQDLVKKDGEYSFSLPVWTAEDSSPGTYKVIQINIGYRSGEAIPFENDTASWGGNVVYEESENIYNGVKSQKLSQFSQSGLSFTLLDAGQGIAQAPIWNELQWKTKSVKAGSIATLVISAEGFTRNIGNISIPLLVPQGDKVGSLSYYSGNNQVVRLIKPVQENSKSAIVKSGTYEVEVYIPRNAKPGNYVIGQLSLLSTSCQLTNMQEISANNKVNNISCQGRPNAWHTTYYLGSVTKDFGAAGYNIKPWVNYKDPLMLPIEVTAPAPLEAPKLEEVKRTPTSLEFRYLYSNEQSCIAKSSSGDLADEKGVKDIYGPLKVNNLKPDSEVTLTLSCSDVTGATAERSATSRTLKPIPPASPKLTLDSVTTDSATFSISIREGFEYSVISDTGKADIQGDKVVITNLQPGVKASLVATIADAYGQFTSTEPIYFSTVLPPKPEKPMFTLGKVTTTRVEFKYSKISDLDYELTVSDGKVTDVNGSVSVSGIEPNTRVTASLKVTDQFGQSSTSDDFFVKSAIPELPVMPLLYLTKTLPDSISLRFTPKSGMKFSAKSSFGVLIISGGSIVISGLKPMQQIQVFFTMSDQYGQLKSSEPYTYMTATVAKVPAKSTITCIKGKTSKVITAVKPTCPTGYTKK